MHDVDGTPLGFADAVELIAPVAYLPELATGTTGFLDGPASLASVFFVPRSASGWGPRIRPRFAVPAACLRRVEG